VQGLLSKLEDTVKYNWLASNGDCGRVGGNPMKLLLLLASFFVSFDLIPSHNHHPTDEW
jgi:hypothetical protein